MIIGPQQLNHLVQFHGLVSPYAGEVKLDSIDLSLGTIWKHSGGASLISKQHRHTGAKKELMHSEGIWTLEPNTFYLAKTIESVNLPPYMAAICLNTSTPFRSGVLVTAGYVDPGYYGEIHFGFTTPGPGQTEIAYGFPMVQLVFFTAEPTVYKGVYNGGKTEPVGK